MKTIRFPQKFIYSDMHVQDQKQKNPEPHFTHQRLQLAWLDNVRGFAE